MVLLSPFVFHLSPLMAQNMTSSPFSRYAYGDMNENVPTGYRAMGGVGFGMRANKAINPSQPASYTACDSLTFMFDVAASASWSRYNDAGGMKNKANGNLEYVTMQFPLWKRWIALSLGLLPYSSVGYNITLRDSIPGYHFTKDYTGDGNISQVYGGLSFNICNWLALGANVYYMWGDLDRMRTLSFDEAGLNATIQDEILSVSNVRLRYGAQLFHTWDKHTVNLGAIFENKMKLNSELIIIETQTDDSIPIYKDGWQLPMVWGVGASYNWSNRLTVAFDYERQCMRDALYNGAPGYESGLQDRNRFAAGVEYRHNPNGRKYVEHMIWRAGMNVQDEYLVSIGAKRISASIGIGFPLWSIGTVINTTIEYTHRGSPAGLEDNSLRFTIGASIAESWFFKRKL
jgi:opacity protein-like surface antigen